MRQPLNDDPDAEWAMGLECFAAHPPAPPTDSESAELGPLEAPGPHPGPAARPRSSSAMSN